MKLTFLGAAETVTGSLYLLESGNSKIIIDCGMFQGLKNLRLLNWEKFDFDTNDIDGVILTHAHVDHSGRLPLLVKSGFRGKIFATAATIDLAEILLKDSAMLQMEDAKDANLKKYTKHSPAKPLYDFEDVQKTMGQFQRCDFHKKINAGEFEVTFYRSGHILGASQVHIKSKGKSVMFSGDIGRYDDPIMLDPEDPIESDVIVMESTYGARDHSAEDSVELLAEIVKDIKSKNAVLMIPSFAVARAQSIVYTLYQVFKRYPNLKIPVAVNSPMAINVTKLYVKHLSEHKLDRQLCEEVFSLPKYMEFPKQSHKLSDSDGPMVVIAGSGMLTGGRILHHLWSWGKDQDNVILLVGYQAEGTRGFDLQKGIRELKVHGNKLNVSARVKMIETFSAHAGQSELLKWVGKAKKSKKVVLVHGEKESVEILKDKIVSETGMQVEVAQMRQTIQW